MSQFVHTFICNGVYFCFILLENLKFFTTAASTAYELVHNCCLSPSYFSQNLDHLSTKTQQFHTEPDFPSFFF